MYRQDQDREAPAPRAKKSLGQNFLQDANIARKIVAALAIAPEDSVLEIGPGPGALTGFLRDCSPSRLVLVEKDEYWARERMAQGGLSIILADALSLAWERFSTPWKIIGNLPYNVASPLMWEIFSRASGLRKAVFMVQKEVGLRLTAQPDTGAYGALSVWTQSFVRPKMEFIVPPQVFWPRPKVDSAVLSFRPLAERDTGENPAPPEKTFSADELALTLHKCFQMRRKQLGTIVRSSGGSADLLEDLGLDPRLRPENLRPEDFHRLANAGIFRGRH